MPYFKNNEQNILFIHIPKTGGTSVEQYFSVKYNIQLNLNAMYGYVFSHKNIKILNKGRKQKFNISPIFRNTSLQHFTYKNIFNYKNILNVDFNDNNLKIISIVRNPYNRIISDLFWFKLINIDTNKEEVFSVIKNKYLIHNTKFDNHNIPQYLFLIDHNEKIVDSIQILKTETLNEDMKKIGYSDFNLFVNDNQNKNRDYLTYLNEDSIKLINNYYEKDFIYFNYEKIIV